MIGSHRGDVLFTKKDQLFIHNFLDDSERVLGTPFDENMAVAWNPDGRYALLQSDNVELLEVATGQRIVLSQATPYRLGDYYYNDGSRQQTWSPDGKHLLFISGQHFYHYDLAQTRLDELPITFDSKTGVNYPGWEWRSNTTVSLVWSDPSQANDYDSTATRCDFAEGVHCITPPASKAQYGRGDVTMDGRYSAFVYEGPEITDTTTHQTVFYRPLYFAYNAARAGEVRFHPTQPWLLTFRHGLVASGGDCCRHYGIIRADGSYQRDLGFMMGFPEPIVLDWLPERVPIAELGSSTHIIQFKPDQIIPGKDWASALLWDVDSERVLLFDGYTGGVYVADRLTGKNQRVFEKKGGGDPYWAFDPASGVSLPARGGTQTPYNPRYEPVWHQNGETHSIDIVEKATKVVVCNLGEDGMRDAWFVIPDAQNRTALIGSPYTVAEVWDIQRCQKIA